MRGFLWFASMCVSRKPICNSPSSSVKLLRDPKLEWLESVASLRRFAQEMNELKVPVRVGQAVDAAHSAQEKAAWDSLVEADFSVVFSAPVFLFPTFFGVKHH